MESVKSGLIVLVGLLPLALVGALIFTRRVDSQTEPANMDDVYRDDSMPDMWQEWPRKITEPVFTEDMGRAQLEKVQLEAANWGAAAVALREAGLLTVMPIGPLVPDGDGAWQVDPAADHRLLAGVALESLKLDDAAGLEILKEFSDDPKANARALIKLATWVDPVTEKPGLSPIPAKRRELLKETGLVGLPETIVVADAVLYSGQGRLVDLGELPAEVLGRVVFRNCVVNSISFTAREPVRLRFEGCYLNSTTRFHSADDAPIELILTDCLSQAMTSMTAGRISAANTVFLGSFLSVNTAVWEASSLDPSVLLGVRCSLDAPPERLGLVQQADESWVSGGVARLSEAERELLVRTKVLSDFRL